MLQTENKSHCVQVGDMVTLHGMDGKTELKKPWNLAAVSISVPRIPKWD